MSTVIVLTLAEAAERLGVTPDTLRQQIANGSLKARKVGPVWTVTPKEVERYARENRRSGHPCSEFCIDPAHETEYREP